MGLEAVLLGAHAEGVRNVLAVTGDPPHVGDYPGSRGVYEVDSIGLVQLISGLNRGEDYLGKGIDAPTSFFVGVAVNPSAADLDLELDRFRRKVDAGAALRDDPGAVRRRAARPVRRAPRRRMADPACSSASGRSAATRWRSGSTTRSRASRFPTRVLAALQDAGADAPAVGLRLARELVEASRARAAGIYVIPPFKQPTAALDLFD